MGQTETKALRPFHETIIDAINSASSDNLEALMSLVSKTKIPANHDAIIEAFNDKKKGMGWLEEAGQDIIESLLRQKAEMK